MANESKRQLIVTAADTRFKTILTTNAPAVGQNNYESNVGSHVYWWLTRNLDPSEMPAIVCADRLVTEWIAAGSWLRTLAMDIEIHLKPSGTAAVVMRQVLSDLERAIGVDVTWGGLAMDTLPLEQERISIEAHDDVLVAAGIRMVVQYETGPWNPQT
jgi:hypothetical protein